MEKNFAKLASMFLLSLFMVSGAAAAPAGTDPVLMELLSQGSPDARELPAVPSPGKSVPAGAPVVIAVSGLDFKELGWGLEVKDLIRIARLLFPCEEKGALRPHCAAGNLSALSSAVAGYNSRYAALGGYDKGGSGEFALPDKVYGENYIEGVLKNGPFTVIPFDWSRDSKDSAAVIKEFSGKLKKVHEKYGASGRPIRILSHSWGTVLMYNALQNLAAEGSAVKVDKFITIGSPLMPGNVLVDMFMLLKIRRQDLEAAVRKPSTVAVWSNLWASRDPFSNNIAAADDNYQVDGEVGDPEKELEKLVMVPGSLGKRIRAELFRLKDIRLWHASYFAGYKAELSTLNRTIDIDVFEPRVMTPLSAR